MIIIITHILVTRRCGGVAGRQPTALAPAGILLLFILL